MSMNFCPSNTGVASCTFRFVTYSAVALQIFLYNWYSLLRPRLVALLCGEYRSRTDDLLLAKQAL